MTESSATPRPLPARVDLTDDDRLLREVDEVIARGPYSADWDSLAAYRPPRWYEDAKFGVFLHWGVYSVPGFESEWYSRQMYLEGSAAFEHHREHYGDQSRFGYKDFIPEFRMERFDPDAWAAVFRRAGAQFVVPVAEHHDGFAMYDTARSRWKAPAMGPQRDAFGELADAVTRDGMVIGASSHRAEHWFFMNGGMRFDSDVRDPEFSDFYGPAQREETAPNEAHLRDWLLRTVEIIDGYRPQVLWFDWWIEQPAFEPYLRRLAAYYYNRAAEWGIEVVINYKWEAFRPGTAVYDIERGRMSGVPAAVWQNDTAVSRSAWCWIEGHDYKPLDDLIAELVDVVARNGVLLLNIGPKPDGTLPEPEIELLAGLGDWLTVNGEAIYGTRPWLIPAEGPTRPKAGSFTDATAPEWTAEDIRFTARHDVTGDWVYATLLQRPADGVARVRAWGAGTGILTREIAEVAVLGARGVAVEWTRGEHSLDVVLPPDLADGIGAVVRLWLAPEETPPRHDFLHG